MLKQDSLNDILCDLYDIKKQARLHKFGTLLKDQDGTEATINDCIENIIEHLEELAIMPA